MASGNSPTCGCCVEQKKRTPSDLYNAPGLSTLRYRVGTHSQFKIDMLQAIAHQAALKDLTSREDDDLAIALMDSWATVADVLSFYQERIANEGYLRTATERRSVLELARTIGYELKPGVAASAVLVFMVEDAPGAPLQSVVDEGTRVMSLPGQNEKLQIFETIEGIEAKVILNDLKPQQVLPQQIKRGLTELYLKGVNTNLAPGDFILLVGEERIDDPGNENWDFRVLDKVTPNPAKDFTHVTWREGLGHELPRVNPAKKPQIFVFRQRASLFGYNAPDWKAMPASVKFSYHHAAAGKEGSLDDFSDGNIYPPRTKTGYTEWPFFDKIMTVVYEKRKIGDKEIQTPKASIYLDAVYPKIIKDSWIILEGQHSGEKPVYYTELYRAVKVETGSQTDFTLSSKTTKVGLDTDENLSGFKRRSTTIYCVNEPFELADQPLTEPVFGNKITLERRVTEFKKGQKIIVSGKRAKVRIVHKRNMTVTPSDGLAENDVLEVLQPSSVNQDGVVTWMLLNKKGVKVKVDVKPENIVPSEGKVTIVGESLLLVSTQLKTKKTQSLHGGSWNNNYTLTILKPQPEINGLGNVKWNLKIEASAQATFAYTPFEGEVTDPSDRVVVVPSDKTDQTLSELATIDDVIDQEEVTQITLKIPDGKTTALDNIYDLASVHIYANVAWATHGETVHETLGSGDGSKINQQFSLKKPPLTYVSAPTPSGATSTLRVYVNDVAWQEVPSLYDLAPIDQCYTVRLQDSGETIIYFGDGKAGARLPSGTENITSIYRSGIGLAGAVGENKLTLLQKRPFGIRSVTNPIAASGAASPESMNDARTNAPSTMLTLDRIVSLKDFEDFARSFSGIAKAKATFETVGEQTIIHLIIAGADAKEIPSSSDLYDKLLNAMDLVRAYGRKVTFESFKPVNFNVQGKIYVDSRYLPDNVKANVYAALQNAFAFVNRTFGQPIAKSDVVAVIQKVPGIIYTDIDKVYVAEGGKDLEEFLVEDAMILMINPDGIMLEAKQ